MTALLAHQFWGLSIEQLAITIVVIAAVVALVFLALRQFKVTIPPWVIEVLWIVVVAMVIILAIRFVASL